MIPVKRAMPTPGPQPSVSMRPGCGPAGRGEVDLGPDAARSSRRRLISSTSGTVAAPWTVLRWMKSGPFSASSCQGQRTFHSVGKKSVHSSVKYSSSWGTSHIGACVGVGVVPEEDEAVALDGRVRADPGLLVEAVAVGDVGVAALAVPLPPVVGADQVAAVDPPAEGQVGAEVGAVGVHDVGRALLVPPEDEVPGQVAEGPDLARGEVVAVGRPSTRRTGRRCSTGSARARSSGSARASPWRAMTCSGVSPGKSRIRAAADVREVRAHGGPPGPCGRPARGRRPGWPGRGGR